MPTRASTRWPARPPPPEGTSLYQVHRATGAKVRVNDGTESIFGIAAHGNTVYRNYRTQAGMTGIRRLSSTGSAVQEAVTPVPDGQSVGIPLVDGSGIYHTGYDGTNYWFWRTSHTDPADKVLVATGGYLPYTNVGAHFTADAIVWLNGCSRGGPGQVFRLAKP